MSDTARDYQTVESASIEGLEDLFNKGVEALISEQGDSDQATIIEQGDPDQTLISTTISPDQTVINVLLKRLADVEKQLTDAQKELQGAVWRNGYLESQLENERQQIKLLTDSQHKGSWWAGFKKWFVWQ